MPDPAPRASFRDRVAAEARQQKELLAAGRPIPRECRRLARISGAIVFLVCSLGTGLILLIGILTGSYYIAVILLFAVLALGGLAQAVTGRHWVSRR